MFTPNHNTKKAKHSFFVLAAVQPMEAVKSKMKPQTIIVKEIYSSAPIIWKKGLLLAWDPIMKIRAAIS